MRDVTLTFRYGKQLYTLRVNSKVTVIQGDSGEGKTFLVNNVTDATKPWYVPGIVRYNHNVTHDRAMALIQNNDIVFIDEEAVVAIREIPGAFRELWNMKIQLVIVCRDSIEEIAYSYKDMYTLRTDGSHTFAVRMYPDFDELPKSSTYVCEDEKSGFQYFRDRLPDVKTMKGNKNCRKWVEGNVLILDGSAIGNYMRELLDKNASLYLPESFEYLLIDYYTSLNRDTLLRSMPPNFKTLEEFCTYLCEVVHVLSFSYHKPKLPFRVYFAQLNPTIPADSNYVKSVEECSGTLNEILYKCGCSNCYKLFDSGENLTAKEIINKLREMKELL